MTPCQRKKGCREEENRDEGYKGEPLPFNASKDLVARFEKHHRTAQTHGVKGLSLAQFLPPLSRRRHSSTGLSGCASIFIQNGMVAAAYTQSPFGVQKLRLPPAQTSGFLMTEAKSKCHFLRLIAARFLRTRPTSTGVSLLSSCGDSSHSHLPGWSLTAQVIPGRNRSPFDKLRHLLPVVYHMNLRLFSDTVVPTLH